MHERCSRACDICKKRKERCDGRQPCGRCRERGVEEKCRFDSDHGVRRRRARNKNVANAANVPNVADTTLDAEGIVCTPQSANTTWEQQSVASLEQSRLVRDKRGRFIFLGDSANLSLLRVIRQVARTCHGESKFVADPLRAGFVEASTDESGSWINAGDGLAPTLSARDASHLVDVFEKATAGLVDFVDCAELRTRLPATLDAQSGVLAQERIIPYLVMAIGAQSSQHLARHADGFFSRGRYLATRHLMDDASILTVQAYVLITVYLLSVSRRNTASMHLRFAIGAMYALGIHRKAVAVRFSRKESLLREKLWTAVRILDLFLSASLGRPVATTETRNTQLHDEYSPWNDLCAVFESVLKQVYEQRSITADVVSKIGEHQREWADRHTKSGRGAGADIGTLHMKQMYHWTIMLLTRPFLIERVVAHVNEAPQQQQQDSSGNGGLRPCSLPDLSKTLVYACVNSAIKTIQLLEPLTQCADLPTRLPLLINAAFHAALVVGLAHFGDLYLVFPLARYIYVAHSILVKFADDAVASRNATIVHYLMDVCQLHVEKRHAASMDVECAEVGRLFGQIDEAQNETQNETQNKTQTPASQQNQVQEVPALDLAMLPMGDAYPVFSPQGIPGEAGFDSSLLGNPQLFWMDFDNDISSLFTIIGPG